MTRYNWIGFYLVDPADPGILTGLCRSLRSRSWKIFRSAVKHNPLGVVRFRKESKSTFLDEWKTVCLNGTSLRQLVPVRNPTSSLRGRGPLNSSPFLPMPETRTVRVFPPARPSQLTQSAILGNHSRQAHAHLSESRFLHLRSDGPKQLSVVLHGAFANFAASLSIFFGGHSLRHPQHG